ncbi:MAG: hypothetical protein GDA46_04000 [Bdellovibrionales bacterium]|nr:hypothetical protein [Bdellovibrionales bacterium]
MLFILLFSLFLIASCFFVAYFGKKWNLHAFLAFSSGMLLSLCILDFLAHSFEFDLENSQNSLNPSLFILAGILLQVFADIYLLPWLSFLDPILKVESPKKKSLYPNFSSFSVFSVVACLTICSFFDGIRLWTAFNLENFIAFSTAFGLFFHLLTEGVLIASLAIVSGFKKHILFILIGILGFVLILGAFTAQFFASNFSFKSVLAFSSGCLMYVCFVHLLPASLKSPKKVWFFIGLFSFSALHFIIPS